MDYFFKCQTTSQEPLTCQHLESRRFSGPVAPEKAETLAALHPEGQVVDGRLAGAGVPLGQVANHLIKRNEAH